MNHLWQEVIPPRVFGGDTEVKIAVQCKVCERKLILLPRDAKYLLTTECPGHPPAVVMNKEDVNL